ncbi:MAG: DUF1540 domain-containing protein [Erysipelotrichaceae bacterium]
MKKELEVCCSVCSCSFNDSSHCCAKTISVGCDECNEANSTHETACKSFKCSK